MNLVSSRNSNLLLLLKNQIRGLKTYENSKYKSSNVKVGDKLTVERKLTEEDLDKFTKLSGDTNTLHTNEPKIYHGAFLLSLVSTVMGTKLPGHGSLLLKQKMRFPNACYVDQTVSINVEVIKNKQDRFVTCNFTVFSHKDKVNVLEGEAVIMILVKPL